MTSHSDKRIDDEALTMSDEEKERALSNIFAVVESAHPPEWAGVPIPEKRSFWKKVKEYLEELLF